jgi:hypothetical protein
MERRRILIWVARLGSAMELVFFALAMVRGEIVAALGWC